MFKTYILLICGLFSLHSFSQIIKGTVYDEKKEPVPGVEIYLDGTSLWTITNDVGDFELNAGKKINTTLVVSYLGYEKQVLANPFDQDFIKIYLIPQEMKLKEVNVVGEGFFKRADKLKVFREQFLGTTKYGKSCKILNEDDVDFFYDLKTNQLIASSEQPIRFFNQDLGYEVEFSLHEFYVNFRYKSIKSSDVIGWMIMGTTFYKDLSTATKTFVKARQSCYSGSQMQFYRKLIYNQLGDDNFKLIKRGKICDQADYFTINERDGYYDVKVKNVLLKPDAKFMQSFTLEHKDQGISYVVFNTSNFSIDGFGNNDGFREINFTGEMSKKRAGDLLPWDYEE